MVGEIGMVDGGSTVWNFDWRREFFAWEEDLYMRLLADLEGIRWMNGVDRWR